MMPITLRKHNFTRAQKAAAVAVVALMVLGVGGMLSASWSILAPQVRSQVIYIRAHTLGGFNPSLNLSVQAAFEPSSVTVLKGTVVTLRVLNLGLHGEDCDIGIDEFGISSPDIPEGGVWEVTFVADHAGVFILHCKDHAPYMVVTLNVVEG